MIGFILEYNRILVTTFRAVDRWLLLLSSKNVLIERVGSRSLRCFCLNAIFHSVLSMITISDVVRIPYAVVSRPSSLVMPIHSPKWINSRDPPDYSYIPEKSWRLPSRQGDVTHDFRPLRSPQYDQSIPSSTKST